MASARQRIGLLPFWKDYDRKNVLGVARLADRLGYDSFWIPEAWGYDAFSLLAEVAAATSKIRLGTAIVNVFSRSPGLLAMSAATLDEMSGGRFILGLGTSGQRVVEGFHGREFQRPLTQTRDVIRAVRTLLDGRPLSEAGCELRDYRPFSLEVAPRARNVPIYVAALKPRAIRSIGELADGWIPAFWPHDELRTGQSWIAEGAAKAGRDPKQIATAPFTSVIPIPGAAANQRAREVVAFYVGGMGDYYKELLSRFGWTEACEEIERLYRKQETRSRAADAVPRAMLESLTIAGDPLTCRRELRRRFELGLEHPIVTLPPGLPWPLLYSFVVALAPSRWL